MPELAGLSLGLAAAAVSVSCAVLVGMLLTHFLPLPNLSMIFLAAVLVCAVTLGSLSAILAAIISFFAYNFFFIEPLYTFTVAEPHELFALIIFLLVAVLTGSLAGRVREQSDAARKRIATIQALYDISRKLSATASLEDVLYVVAYQAASGIKGQALVLLPKDGDVEIRAAYPPEDTLGPGEAAAARWALRHGEVSGWRSGTLPNAQYQFHPMRTLARHRRRRRDRTARAHASVGRRRACPLGPARSGGDRHRTHPARRCCGGLRSGRRKGTAAHGAAVVDFA